MAMDHNYNYNSMALQQRNGMQQIEQFIQARQVQLQQAQAQAQALAQAEAMQQQYQQQQQAERGYGFDGPRYGESFAGSTHTGGSVNAFRPDSWGGYHQRQATQGYGIDSNRNGRFDRGADGVIVFDTNHDGKYNAKDVQKSHDMMRAAAADVDFNQDGIIDASEKAHSAALRKEYRKVDKDGDGRLSAEEINKAGGKMWFDKDQNGQVHKSEMHSVYKMPNPNPLGGSQCLDYIDPFSGASRTRDNGNWGWDQPSAWRPIDRGFDYPGIDGDRGYYPGGPDRLRGPGRHYGRTPVIDIAYPEGRPLYGRPNGGYPNIDIAYPGLDGRPMSRRSAELDDLRYMRADDSQLQGSYDSHSSHDGLATHHYA